jgi:hypothetical protein
LAFSLHSILRDIFDKDNAALNVVFESGGSSNAFSEHSIWLAIYDKTNSAIRVTAPAFTGAGSDGLVPDPGAETGKYLKDDGTWGTPGGGGAGNDIYIEEEDSAKANSGTGDLTLDFDGSDFDLTVESGNEVRIALAGGGGSGNAIYVEEEDAAKGDSSSDDLTIDFDGTDFNISAESGNELRIAIENSGIDHAGLTNTHNLTTDIDHDALTNTHNLTTDIDHDALTNTHNLTTDIDHDQLTNFSADEHFTEASIDHNSITNTHNLTTDIDHNSITNTHNLTTDIDHDSITNGHNLTTDIDHDSLTNTHDLTTDIDHDSITNTHNLTTDIDHDALTNFVAAEHVSLPNTIANVLSDHNKAAHDALGLSHDSLSDVSADDHHNRSHTMTSTSDHTAGNYKVFYSDGAAAVQELALGLSGEVLYSNGAAAAPYFGALPAGSDPWTIVKLSADFTTTSASAQNVTSFNFTPSRNKTYLVYGYFFLRTATATIGARPGVSWPTGLTDNIGRAEAVNSATASSLRFWGGTGTAAANSTGLPDTTNSHFGTCDCVMRTGASVSGNFQITLQAETAGTTVTMKAGSFIMYREI